MKIVNLNAYIYTNNVDGAVYDRVTYSCLRIYDFEEYVMGQLEELLN